MTSGKLQIHFLNKKSGIECLIEAPSEQHNVMVGVVELYYKNERWLVNKIARDFHYMKHAINDVVEIEKLVENKWHEHLNTLITT
jgi:hypothetical protein